MELNKPIEVRLLPEAEDYFEGLPENIQVKLLKSFDKTQVGLKGKWFKQLKGKHLDISGKGSPKILSNFGILGQN